MSIVDLLLGRAVEIVGVEDEPGYQPGAGTRVYVGHRYKGLYFVVHGRDAENVKREWAAAFTSHLFMSQEEVPPLRRETEG